MEGDVSHHLQWAHAARLANQQQAFVKGEGSELSDTAHQQNHVDFCVSEALKVLAQTVEIDITILIHWRNGGAPDASKLRLTCHVVDSLL